MSHSFNVGNISRKCINYLEANGYMFIPSWWGGGVQFLCTFEEKIYRKTFYTQ